MSTEKKQGAFGFADREPVWVVGYPKSGNTWLSRLLGEYLNSPIQSPPPARAIAEEGLKRPGKYVIQQAHLNDCPDNGKVIFIYRDPRDVCVSASFYWDIKPIRRAIKVIAEGLWPVPHGNGWASFQTKWANKNQACVDARTSYESLSENGVSELIKLVRIITGDNGDVERAREVIKNQSFSKRRGDIEKYGTQGMSYGPKVQLKNMRKGIVGDWRNHFSRSDAKLADEYFGDWLQAIHSEKRNWWKELPIKE